MSIDPHSTHYDAGGIETIDIIAAKLTPEQYIGYLMGNVLKYTTRANFKGDGDRDLDKARVYLGLLEHLSINRQPDSTPIPSEAELLTKRLAALAVEVARLKDTVAAQVADPPPEYNPDPNHVPDSDPAPVTSQSGGVEACHAFTDLPCRWPAICQDGEPDCYRERRLEPEVAE